MISNKLVGGRCCNPAVKISQLRDTLWIIDAVSIRARTNEMIFYVTNAHTHNYNQF